MSIAIQIENLSKCYSIAHRQETRDESLRIAVERRVRALASHLLGRDTQSTRVLPVPAEGPVETHEDFYALRDLSFDVRNGERVGIIGANGAGKSTLLKILSRITEPSHGRVVIRGRVSSLLEVGTGFHPELTGRENVFLNGAILGMPRSEIRSKFDEIVDFSEVEQFLDTPVKHYSSGMYVRLAFAVAAHLDPEVLILDEVLAVGDARFQKKCLAKMRRFSDEGRTVLFVSHSASAIGQFCTTAVHLEKGRLKRIGPAQEVVEDYMNISTAGVEDNRPDLVCRYEPPPGFGDAQVELLSLELLADGQVPASTLPIGQRAILRTRYRVRTPSELLFVPNLHIRTWESLYVCVLMPPNTAVRQQPPGVYVADCELPASFLNVGIYTVQLAISSFNAGQQVHVNAPSALTFEVVDDLSDLSHRNGYRAELPGVVRPHLPWTIGAGA